MNVKYTVYQIDATHVLLLLFETSRYSELKQDIYILR